MLLLMKSKPISREESQISLGVVMRMKKVMLEVRELSKRFGSTVALDSFSFTVHAGEIHGLIGENGSGKSTAASIVAGMQHPDGGEMFFCGQPWKPGSALEAQKGGVGMIVQEAGCIADLTVAQNIFLGGEREFSTGPFVNARKMNERAQEALDILQLEGIYPSMPVRLLDMQQRKLVELAKLLYARPKLLIVDETSTALSLSGRNKLYEQMLRLRAEGNSVLIISHDLQEIQQYCDSVTVLRDGKGIVVIPKEEYSDAYLRNSMIGRELKENYYRADCDGYGEQVVLKAERITDLDSFMNVSLELHRGEILGVGGLSECGMHELGQALYGDRAVLTGAVTVGEVQVKSCKQAVRLGVAYLSKDRDRESLALGSTIYNNIASTGYRRNKTGGFMSGRKERNYVQKQQEQLSIKCRDVHQEVKALSGGNKQKVVFGKWIAADPDIYIMDCPTRGVDVGVKAAMYQLMDQLRRQGKSIVMISEEMPELIGMSDRILMMKDGRIAGEFHRAEGFTEQKLVEVMI